MFSPFHDICFNAFKSLLIHLQGEIFSELYNNNERVEEIWTGIEKIFLKCEFYENTELTKEEALSESR